MPIREEAINVFLNQPGDGDEPRLELTFNFGVSAYEIGTAYGHIAISAGDLDGTLAELASQGIDARARALPHPRGRRPDLLREGPGRLPRRDSGADVAQGVQARRAVSEPFVVRRPPDAVRMLASQFAG